MSAVIFRKALKQDLSQILQLNQKFVPRVGEVTTAWLEKYLQEAAHFEIAEKEGEIVGFLIAMLPDADYGSENFLWFKKNSKKFVYVDRIAVAEDQQGTGLGKEFYERLIRAFKGKADEVTCEVNLRPENPQSLKAHAKFGFKEVGQQETKNGQIRVSLLARKI